MIEGEHITYDLRTDDREPLAAQRDLGAAFLDQGSLLGGYLRSRVLSLWEQPVLESSMFK